MQASPACSYDGWNDSTLLDSDIDLKTGFSPDWAREHVRALRAAQDVHLSLSHDNFLEDASSSSLGSSDDGPAPDAASANATINVPTVQRPPPAIVVDHCEYLPVPTQSAADALTGQFAGPGNLQVPRDPWTAVEAAQLERDPLQSEGNSSDIFTPLPLPRGLRAQSVSGAPVDHSGAGLFGLGISVPSSVPPPPHQPWSFY